MQTQPLSFQDFRRSGKKAESPFAQREEEAQESQAPPPPSYTQEELDAAVARSREEGIAEGRTAERSAIDHEARQQTEMLAGLVTQLMEQLPPLREQAAQMQQRSLARIPEISLALAQSIARHAVSHYPAEGVIGMIRETAGLLQRPLEGFRLEAHPDTIAALERHLEAASLADLTVLPNTAIHPGNGALRWEGGHAEHDIAACVSRLEDLLQSFGAEPLDGNASTIT